MNAPNLIRHWRHYVLILIGTVPLLILLFLPPIHQDAHYHAFADMRRFLGIPNFADVVSNAPFLIVGMAGIMLGARGRLTGYSICWFTFFVGVSMVSVGSGYYHWNPNNDTLVWDRLPMTVGFMGLFMATVNETVHPRLGTISLLPGLVLGAGSVVYWHYYDDLRFYAWVQYGPLLMLPFLLALFPRQYSHRYLLLIGLGCYLMAKLFEAFDREVFAIFHGRVAGHAIKHLWAAAGCLCVLQMLRKRSSLAIPTQSPAATGLGTFGNSERFS
jgi:hypothetical protein